MPEFLAFDFDGVLADSVRIAIEEYELIIQSDFPSVPVPRNADDLAHMFPGPLRTSLQRFGLTADECKRFFDLHSEAMRKRAAEVVVFNAVVDAVLRLPCERRAIVTSAYSDAVRDILQRAGFTGPLEILGREIGMRKSAKLAYLARTHAVDMGSIVKVGDMVSDILYAREAGTRIWAVGWGYHPPSYLAAFGPDILFKTAAQLVKHIEEH